MSRTRRRRAVSALVAVSLALVLASPVTGSAQDSKPTIAVTGADLNSGTVEITNHGASEVDVNGLILCNFPAYAPIADAPVIAPGETITVDSAGLGVGLNPETGEMGIYTVADYENPDAMITYVEWGETGHQRARVAIDAGVWADGTAEVVDGVIAASVDNPTTPDDWIQSVQDDGGTDEQVAESETPELARTGAAASGALSVVAVALLAGGWILIGHNRRRSVH